jgi:hypothetical protein
MMRHEFCGQLSRYRNGLGACRILWGRAPSKRWESQGTGDASQKRTSPSAPAETSTLPLELRSTDHTAAW